VSSGALLLALLQGIAGAAPGQDAPAAPVIAVVLPSATAGPMLDALTRLRGEADSVGLELKLVAPEANAAPSAQLARVAEVLRPTAVVALVGGGGPAAAPTPSDVPASSLRTMDVWFLDPATGQTSVGHLTVDEEAGARADLVLAVRVVDFIRARMFDSLVKRLAAGKPRPAPAPPHEVSGRRHLAAGVGSLGSFTGFDAAFLPALEIGYGLRPWLRLTLFAAGLGSEPRRELPEFGSASLRQTLLRLSAVAVGRTWWRLRPYAELGADAYFLSVHGIGYGGNVGYDPSSWSPGGHGGGGFGFTVARHVELRFGGSLTLLVREPKVYVADNQVARTGRPTWMGQALIGAVF
jgi:hypothetical protein